MPFARGPAWQLPGASAVLASSSFIVGVPRPRRNAESSLTRYRIVIRVCKPAGQAASGTPSPSFAARALGNRRTPRRQATLVKDLLIAVTFLPMDGHVITISGMGAVAGPEPLLLERDAELARLSARLGNAQAGSGSVVAVSGPAGIGKTELLTAVHRLAGDRGFRSLRARGRELEAGMAFSVVRQLLEQ